MSAELAIISELQDLARRYNASPQAHAWLVQRRNAAMKLLFQEIGYDETGRAGYRVGNPERPEIFYTRLCDGMRSLLLIAQGTRLPVTDVTDAPSGAEAARRKLHTALKELHGHCPPLAAALYGFTIQRGYVIYQRGGFDPEIIC